MKHLNRALFLSSCLFCSISYSNTKKTAKFMDGAGQSIGQVQISEYSSGVKLALDIKGAKPGVHGFHLHQAGKCEGPDFKSAGAHFNPLQKEHGKKNVKGPHLGDLPNIQIPQNGELKLEVRVPGVAMKSGELNSIASKEGTSLIIHAAPDDDQTDPSGNSGDRIYCAVLVAPQSAAPVSKK